MLDPVPFGRPRPRGCAPSGDDPRCGQIALLAKIGPQDPDVEISGCYPLKPAVEHPKGRVDGYRLVVTGGRAWPDRAGVGAVLPEESAHAGPVAPGEPPGITAEELMDRVLVPAGARWGAVLDPALGAGQDSDKEDRETPTAQTDRWCVSRWASSSRFS